MDGIEDTQIETPDFAKKNMTRAPNGGPGVPGVRLVSWRYNWNIDIVILTKNALYLYTMTLEVDGET